MQLPKTIKILVLILKFWPLISILIIVFLFHIRLFFPQTSIYITPDYGRSDAWHLSIANKYYYSKELKNNRIPIWNPHIGTGYPTLAEGQTGVFFLPNIIFLKMLPFSFAYNVLIVTAFVTAACGCYFFLRSIGLTKFVSTYGGLIFSLGSFFVFHVQHLHLLQTASLVPWTFWITNEYLKRKERLALVLISLIISQQIFAGFPQITAYNLVFLLTYILLKSDKKLRLKNLGTLSFFILIGFLLSAIQLIPTYEFVTISTKIKDPKTILEQFPLQIKNLVQFINPFFLGSPRDASYPHISPGKWGIFWESTGYVGIIPLCLSLLQILSQLFKGKRPNIFTSNTTTIFCLLLVMAILLSLGKLTPLHPLFSLPPFSLFRVPSRFLLFAQFSLVVLSAMYISKLSSKLKLLLCILSILELFYVLFTYNPVAISKLWFDKPQTAKLFDSVDHERIITFGNFASWDETFRKNGWKDLPYYNFARNYLDQNSNLIFDIDQFYSYESMQTKRASLINQLVNTAVKINPNEIVVSPQLINFLATRNVSNIIATKEIKDQNLERLEIIEFNESNKIYIYKIKPEPKLVIAASKYFHSEFPSEIVKKISDVNYDPMEEPIIEENIGALTSKDTQLKTVKESGNEINIHIETDGRGLLIINQSYYPGWTAKLNHETVKILPTNINSQGIIIPTAGTYTLSLQYKPQSLRLGILLTGSVSMLLIIIIVTKVNKKHGGYKLFS